jgi:hypothetical protein
MPLQLFGKKGGDIWVEDAKECMSFFVWGNGSIPLLLLGK